MNTSEIIDLERKIFYTLEKGFSRTPSPHEKSYDSADFSAAAKDILDMILGDYFVSPHPTDKEWLDRVYKDMKDGSMSKALEVTSQKMDGLIKTMNEFVYGRNIGSVDEPHESDKDIICPCPNCYAKRENEKWRVKW